MITPSFFKGEIIVSPLKFMINKDVSQKHNVL